MQEIDFFLTEAVDFEMKLLPRSSLNVTKTIFFVLKYEAKASGPNLRNSLFLFDFDTNAASAEGFVAVNTESRDCNCNAMERMVTVGC